MKAIQILRKLRKETKADVYYAGRYARDILRRKKSKEIEVLVTSLTINQIAKFLRKHTKRIKVSKYSGYVSFIASDRVQTTLYLPKRNEDHSPFFTLRDDVHTRDFTVNAMYIPVNGKRKVIDFYNGRSNIRERKIKVIGKADAAIKKRPELLIGAIEASAELNYRIDNNLFYAIKAHSGLIERVSVDLVRDALINILLHKTPSRYLRKMEDLGILRHIIPELSIGVGIAQNEKYHKHDVFTHGILACDYAEKDLIVRLSALLHDVGKPQTREEIIKNNKRRVTFYNHEVASAKIAAKILRRLRFDKEVISKVYELIYNHMYNYEPDRWTDAAVRRFIRKVNITDNDLKDLDNLPVFLLRKADRAANGLDLSEVSGRQYAFQDRIKKVYAKADVLTVSDLAISGKDVMRIFKLKEGPTVGHILNYLLSLVIEDQDLNDKKVLVNKTSEYLSTALK